MTTLMHPFDELVAYIGFSHEDSAALRSLWPAVQPRVPSVTAHFYEVIERFDGARRVLRDAQQVERLKGMLATWLEQLFIGPHDHVYYERRLRMGQAHVRVGLEPHYMFAAMSVMRADLLAIARSTYAETAGGAADADAATRVEGALTRITDLELAIMIGAYIEQREQALLRDALERRLPLTVLLVEQDGRIAAATGAASPLLARPDVAGIHVRDALPAPIVVATKLEESIVRATELGESVTIPFANARVGDVDSVFRLTVIPIRTSVSHALVHLEDLTETVAQERNAHRAQQAATLGHLAKTVAHEMRNPLAGISGTVQVVASSMDANDHRRAVLERLQDEVLRLGSLCADLLAFTQPSDLRNSDVDLAAVAAAAAVQVDHALLTSTQVDGEGRASADATALTQVLFNLIENAWQAGARNVVLHVGDRCVRVLDDGPGVPFDVAARLFEPFFTTKTRGTGLGLPIAKKLIEAMGGTLASCPSSLGGAGFEVTLLKSRTLPTLPTSSA